MSSFIQMCFIILYFFPIYEINKFYNFQVDKTILGIVGILLTIFIFLKNNITKESIIILLIIIYRLIFLKDIYALNLIFIILCYETRNYKYQLISNLFFKLILLSICCYSILYYGEHGRIIHTSIREVNESGLFIFFLIVIFYNRREKICFLLATSMLILTASRTGLLALIIFLVCENSNIIKNIVFKFKNYYFQIVLSVILLIAIAFSFENAYRNNKISEYKETFRERILNPYDFSNFFRFTINKNLIEIMLKNKEYLIKGIKYEELGKENLKLTRKKQIPYRDNIPHNYIFSYIQIYGIFSLGIFWVMGKILNSQVTKNNISFYMSLFLYTSLLGIGLNSYYIFIVLYIAKELNEREKIE